MDLRLAGKRILVGGGSRGLGAAIASVLAAEGARLALIARGAAELRDAARRLGGVPVPVDLAARGAPEEAVAAASDQLGGLDAVLVNSGGPPPGTFEALDEEAWTKAIDGTLLSAIRLIRAALPVLREGIDPAILVVLSSSVREPVPALVTSNVLRPGLNGLIKSLAGEIAPIRINGIAPGRLDTDRVRSLDRARAAETGKTTEEVRAEMEARIPLGRYGEAREIGPVAAFLLSPAASYVNGVVLPVDGGMVRSLP